MALTLTLTAGLPAAVQASETVGMTGTEQVSGTEQTSEAVEMSGTEQVSETEQTSETVDTTGTEQVSETEQTSETDETSQTGQTSETVTEQENTDVPSAYAVQVSASLDGEAVVITICGSAPAVDRLLVTLPGGDSQILSSINGMQFILTAAADQQGERISYIPGTSGESDITWYDALCGTFTIPQIENGSDVGTEDDTDAEAGDGIDAETEDVDSGKKSSSAKTGKKNPVTGETGKTETIEQTAAEETEATETAETTEQTAAEEDADTSEKTEKQKTKTSSGSGKSKSSGTGKGKSGSGTKGKSGNTGTEESKTVTTAKSALGSFLLDSGRTLTYSPDDAAELAGMTYEATWEEEDGIRIYIYEEGGAILELSQEKLALRFLLIQEGTDDESTARLWQQVLELASL